MSPEVSPLWERALKALESARQLLPVDRPGSVNRAYYSAFYAVSALLAIDDAHFAKHQAVRAAVHRDLVKPGIWPKELGSAYDGLFDLRTIADYEVEEDVTPEQAENAIDAAECIIEEIRETHPELFGSEAF